MKYSKTIISVIAIIAIAAIGTAIYLYSRYNDFNSQIEEQKKANLELQELAALDKAEMEDQYKQFDIQYRELQKQLKNDSLVAVIESERRHTQQLLEELKRTKATDVAEITRLKKEIANLRNILKGYIVQVDSLNSLNKALTAENQNIKQQYNEATTTITKISTENTNLKDKVDKASQLDATGFYVSLKNKKGKEAKKVKDLRTIAIGFNIVKNVTAKSGQKIVYARILKPDNSVLKTSNATFKYEDTELDYSIKKYIEYTGEEQAVILYWNVNETLSPGNYKVFIFCDSRMIGQSSFTLTGK
jgi:hypothetical protein